MALARGAEQVRPPHRHHLRMILRRVGILAGEPQAPRPQLRHHVLGRVDPRPLGLLDQLQSRAIKAGVGRQPPQACPQRVDVDDMAPVEQAASQWRGQVRGPVALVAPLVGGQVEERRARLMARRAHPVERERDRLPARQRPDLLLADVVRPAAAVHALAAAQHHQRQERPVDLIGMEPVVGPRAHRDHRPTLGDLRVAGKLPRHPRRQVAVHAGDLLLPRRRARLRVVVVGRPLAGQPLASHPVVGERQIQHRRHELSPNAPDRHARGAPPSRPRPRRHRTAVGRSPPARPRGRTDSAPARSRPSAGSSAPARRSGGRQSRPEPPGRRCGHRSRPASTRRARSRRRRRQGLRRAADGPRHRRRPRAHAG